MSALAQTTTFTGNTTGGPLWDPPAGAANNVAYNTVNFTADAGGGVIAYRIEVVDADSGFDTYLFLYSPSFDPNNENANLIAVNDDGGVSLLSRLDLALADGDYIVVVSGFRNDDDGAWELEIERLVNPAVSAPGAAQTILAGDTRELVGTLWHRRTAAFGGGRQPVANFANPYQGGGWMPWIRLGGSKADATGNFLDEPVSYDSTLGFVQAGIAGTFMDDGTNRWVGSVFGHYADSDASLDGGAAIASESAGVGVSVTWLASSGLYADLVGLVSFHDLNLVAGVSSGSTQGETIAGSVELGYSHVFGQDVMIVPQAQLVYLATDIDSYPGGGQAPVEFGDGEQLEGRVGLHIQHRSEMFIVDGILTANAGVDVLHDFINESSATFDGTLFGFDAEGTEIKIGGGVAVASGAGQTQFGLQADYRIPLDDAGREGASVEATAGIRF